MFALFNTYRCSLEEPQGEVIPGGKCQSWFPDTCWGEVCKCNSCGETYCKRHYIGCKSSRLVGGHCCPDPCNTLNNQLNTRYCRGKLIKCPHCRNWFCNHHILANELSSSSMIKIWGGHFCEQYTTMNMGGLENIGRAAQIGQSFWAMFAPSPQFKDQVELGLCFYNWYHDLEFDLDASGTSKLEGAEDVLLDVLVEKPGQEAFPLKKGAELSADVMSIFGERLVPQDLNDMFRRATTKKTVLVSMNWAFCTEANYQKRLETLRVLAMDPLYEDFEFIIRNDQVGYDLKANYAADGHVFGSTKTDPKNSQKQWECWFCALTVATRGICITQRQADGKHIVSANTARELLAFKDMQETRGRCEPKEDFWYVLMRT